MKRVLLWFNSQSWLVLSAWGRGGQQDNSSTFTGRLGSARRGWRQLVNQQQLTAGKGPGSLPSVRGRGGGMTKQLCAWVMKQRWLSFGSGSPCSAAMRASALIRKSKAQIRTCCRNYICYETICSPREITKAAALHMLVLCWFIRSRLHIYPTGLYHAP